ncbi:hypothetical protein RHMOL_Rhmol04G0341400 [Rhododendron molle]|uniref:Uncharacterized protein n=1 Tax=Rhododendron molle TaxID=49168 RepID=A0ACC0P9P4_RHOML|nr:hypothetical protein RHMOL_Rhmol04G0341400 [Rhododendron molle]
MGRGLPHIPSELIINILSRLSVKSLCRFKSVSKPWLALISDRQFVKAHLNHQSTKDNKTQKLILACRFYRNVYSLDLQAPDPAITEIQLPYKPIVAILGSLNGILLIRTGKTFRLWNPSIRMFQKFKPPDFPSRSTIYGLSYDSASDDFKVVMAIMPSRKDAKAVVHVFSARLSSWNRIGDFGYQIYGSTSGTVLNGAPHSVVERLGAGMGSAIVYFDATEEKFKEVPSPDCEGANMLARSSSFGLGVLGGSLCVVKRHDEGHADVWVMKEYGVKESWTKLFVIPIASGEFYSYRCMPLCYANDGEVVMALDSKKLVSYNPEENSYQTISIAEVRPKFDVALYVESLASPHVTNIDVMENDDPCLSEVIVEKTQPSHYCESGILPYCLEVLRGSLCVFSHREDNVESRSSLDWGEFIGTKESQSRFVGHPWMTAINIHSWHLSDSAKKWDISKAARRTEEDHPD